MKNYFSIVISAFLFCALHHPTAAYAQADPTPLGKIDLSKHYKVIPQIKDFRYWFGEIKNGELVYLSKNTIGGFEAELHIRFAKTKISSYLLLLGPAGINSINCVSSYNKITNLLNDKHGHFISREILKDPIIDDLILANQCDFIRIGGLSIKTKWKTKELEIISEILGDSQGYYIEIEFNSYKNYIDPANKSLFKLF